MSADDRALLAEIRGEELGGATCSACGEPLQDFAACACTFTSTQAEAPGAPGRKKAFRSSMRAMVARRRWRPTGGER